MEGNQNEFSSALSRCCSTRDERPQETVTFLNLPLDIRRIIYECLIPDAKVPSKRPFRYPRRRPTGEFWQPIRHDKVPVSIGILLANRQIYREMIDMWYSFATFNLGLGTNMQISLCMLNKDFMLPFNLPETFGMIRTIHLTVSLKAEPSYSGAGTDNPMSSTLSKHNPLMAGLVDSIRNCESKLRTLELTLQVDLPFWQHHVFKSNVYADADSPVPYDDCRRDAESTLAGLKYNLEPLRRLRGVQMSAWSISNHRLRGYHCELGFRDDEEIERVKREMTEVAHDYMRVLTDVMYSKHETGAI